MYMYNLLLQTGSVNIMIGLEMKTGKTNVYRWETSSWKTISDTLTHVYKILSYLF